MSIFVAPPSRLLHRIACMNNDQFSLCQQVNKLSSSTHVLLQFPQFFLLLLQVHLLGDLVLLVIEDNQISSKNVETLQVLAGVFGIVNVFIYYKCCATRIGCVAPIHKVFSLQTMKYTVAIKICTLESDVWARICQTNRTFLRSWSWMEGFWCVCVRNMAWILACNCWKPALILSLPYKQNPIHFGW